MESLKIKQQLRVKFTGIMFMRYENQYKCFFLQIVVNFQVKIHKKNNWSWTENLYMQYSVLTTKKP